MFGSRVDGASLMDNLLASLPTRQALKQDMADTLGARLDLPPINPRDRSVRC
jgi:hypothetical protein